MNFLLTHKIFSLKFKIAINSHLLLTNTKVVLIEHVLCELSNGIPPLIPRLTSKESLQKRQGVLFLGFLRSSKHTIPPVIRLMCWCLCVCVRCWDNASGVTPWKGHSPTQGPIRGCRQPQSRLNYRFRKVPVHRWHKKKYQWRLMINLCFSASLCLPQSLS